MATYTMSYITPGGKFPTQTAMGWMLMQVASIPVVEFGGLVLQEVQVNKLRRHCRIGRITLKEAK